MRKSLAAGLLGSIWICTSLELFEFDAEELGSLPVVVLLFPLTGGRAAAAACVVEEAFPWPWANFLWA